jgi:hypothetical protein
MAASGLAPLLTGVQKSAILLIALGEQGSAGILKHLSEDEVQMVSNAIANLPSGVRHESQGCGVFFFCGILLSGCIRTEEEETHMSDSLAALEAQRSKLLAEFHGLGDLRPGSITAVVRRCGKPTCHCAKPQDPGHDPQFRLTRRVAGKTVTETFPNPTALRKAQQEVAEFHRFQELSQELVALNEKICQLRPVEQQRGGWTAQEKKRLLHSIRRWHGKLTPG